MGLGLSRKQMTMVSVLLSGTLLAVLNMTLLTPALPTIMEEMNVSQTTVQWLTSGYSLVEAVIIPLSAYLMGRFSTRRLFMGGIGVFALGSIVAATAPNFWFILAGRMLQAVCTGAIMPMVSSVILMEFPRERRGSAMGLIGLIIGFAPTIGPTVSGIIVDSIGWRALFYIVFALALAVIVVAAFELRNTGEFERTRFDAPSVVLSTFGLVSLLYGLSSFSSTDNLALTLGLIAAGLVIIAFYVRRQNALDEPMLKLDILKSRRYRTAVIIIALFQAALIGMETIMPLYIQDVLGHSATVSGLTLLPGALLGAVTGMLAGRIFDRHGVRRPVLIGACIITAAALGFAFLLRIDTYIVVVSAVYATMALGIQFAMTPMNTWGVNSLPNDDIRYAQSTSNTINQVAASFGTALLVSISAFGSVAVPDGSALQQTFAGYHLSFSGTATIAILAVVLIVALVRNRAGDADAESVAVHRAGGYTVGDVMNPHAVTVPSSATVADAVGVMAKSRTNGISVVDGQGKLVGFIADREIGQYLQTQDASYSNPQANIYALIRDDADLRDRHLALAHLNVMELAKTKVITVDSDMSLDDASKVLSTWKIKKAPVLHEGKLVGAISVHDLLYALMERLEAEEGEQPAAPAPAGGAAAQA